jgi:hypothetical protein
MRGAPAGRARCCVALLCGVPGAGKTTVAGKLRAAAAACERGAGSLLVDPARLLRLQMFAAVLYCTVSALHRSSPAQNTPPPSQPASTCAFWISTRF